MLRRQMEHSAQSSFRLRCPDGRRFALAYAVEGIRTAELARFLRDALRVVVCQGMSCAAAVDTLDLAVGHYFGADYADASVFVAEWDDDFVRWCSAGDLEAVHVVAPARIDILASCGPMLGRGERGMYHERVFSPIADGILAVAAPAGNVEMLMHPIAQSLRLGVPPASLHLQGKLLVRTGARSDVGEVPELLRL